MKSKKRLSVGMVLVAIVFSIVKAIYQPNLATYNSNVPLPSQIEAHVVKVVDGDTIKIKQADSSEVTTVRLIGINTPESVDPRVSVQCFGKEASHFMESLVFDKDVVVKGDPTQGDKDKYGRTLGYVYLSDGEFVNLIMISSGYAFEYTYNIPYEFRQEFKDAENKARTSGIGLWDKSKCDYTSNPKYGKGGVVH